MLGERWCPRQATNLAGAVSLRRSQAATFGCSER